MASTPGRGTGRRAAGSGLAAVMAIATAWGVSPAPLQHFAPAWTARGAGNCVSGPARGARALRVSDPEPGRVAAGLVERAEGDAGPLQGLAQLPGADATRHGEEQALLPGLRRGAGHHLAVEV